MNQPSNTDLLEELQMLCAVSPDVRFGQLIANLQLLVDDRGDQGLWEIENGDFKKVISEHRVNVSKTLSQVPQHSAP